MRRRVANLTSETCAASTNLFAQALLPVGGGAWVEQIEEWAELVERDEENLLLRLEVSLRSFLWRLVGST